VTNIYIYCLFDGADNFFGVYSSIKSVHRDALKIANQGNSPVRVEVSGQKISPTLTTLRNILKGKCDVLVRYRSGPSVAKIIKTKLKE
jgi:hypothetical protein